MANPTVDTGSTAGTQSQGILASEPNLKLGLLAAFTAVVLWACPTLIGKSLPLSSLTLVLFRGWMGVAMALAILRFRGGRLTLIGMRYCLVGGIALGADLMLFFAAIKSTTVANATLISSMTPLLLMFLAPMLFGERLRWPDIAAAFAAMGGATMVGLASSSLEGWSLRGDTYAAICLVSWAIYLAASKAARRRVGAMEFTTGVALIASCVITPFALLHADLAWPEPLHYAYLGLMASSGLIAHVLMNWSLAHIPLWAGGTSTLAVPVVATTLAAVFLGEPFLPRQALGMAIVVVALAIVSLRSPKLVS